MKTIVTIEALLALQLVNELPTEEERDRALAAIAEVVAAARARRRAPSN